MVVAAMVSCWLLAPPLLSAQPNQPKWRMGNELNQQIQTSLSVAWTESGLHDCLTNLSEQQQVAIWIDRRVDPSIPLTFRATNATFEQVLWGVAEHFSEREVEAPAETRRSESNGASQQLGVCRLDYFYYFGPAETAAVLPMLWERMKKETRDLKTRSDVRWHTRDEFVLPLLTNPADTLLQLSQKHVFQITTENLPHDCWRPQRLPSLSLDQQIAMLSVGFGKWFRRSENGQKIQLIDLPKIQSERMKFEIPERAKIELGGLKEAFPDCQITGNRRSLSATGTPQQLAVIRMAIVKSQRPLPITARDEKRFTLKTRAARGSILATIAQQTGNQLKFDPVLNETLQQIIEINVEQIPINELIEATLEGTGTSYRIGDGKLEVFTSP